MKHCFYPLLMVLVLIFAWNNIVSAQTLHGTVLDDDGRPVAGANVKYVIQNRQTQTSSDGRFILPLPAVADTVLISHIGYHQRSFTVAMGQTGPLTLSIQTLPNTLEEVVVNTGYYQIPKERATGAFTHVDKAIINRSVSTNILERLEGVVNGLQFIEPQATDASGIRVRGLSTIEADTRPLIVVDNFPYEGDINTINPNDVESITVLRDAAAASIWGARAGNGVIVINTKQGQYNQPTRISVNSSVNIAGTPDLLYNQNYLPSATVMEIQRHLFEQGTYPENDQTYIPSYVELLIKKRDGLITDEAFASREAFMQRSDLRQQAMEYLYQPTLNQQHNVSVRGGGERYRYMVSAGYDNNRGQVVGNRSKRTNLMLQNTFKVRPGLELSGSIWYTKRSQENNGITYQDLGLFSSSSLGFSNIYDALAKEDGSPAFTFSRYRQAYRERAEKNGLLDWMYRPLDEQRLADNTSGNDEIRLNASLQYQILKGLDIHVNYQNTFGDTWSRQYYHPDSYYVRDYVNRYTQPDGEQIIPHGGMLETGNPTSFVTHAGRGQLNYSADFGQQHQLSVLVGGEVRQNVLKAMPGMKIYDYDKEFGTGETQYDYMGRWSLRPSGTGRIPLTTTTANAPNSNTSHDLSYFGNLSYTFRDRYVLSSSLRWDGSNLLGVKTNQRGTALWSVGGSWKISEEEGYALHWLPFIRLRITYGSAGNIDKSQSHYPIIQVGINSETGLPQSTLRQPGNPSLRWEQVNTFNAGVDWRLAENRVSGSIEYYNKHAKHLLGSNLMDPTTGVGVNYKMNYANLRTQGWDVQINSHNLIGDFSWTTDLLTSYTYNKVTSYNAPLPAFIGQYFSDNPVSLGKSVDIIYALPWHGLSADNGYPIVYQSGQATTDYVNYYNSLTPDDIRNVGVRVPPFFGSLRNTFSWKSIELGFLLSFKAGHVFRRSSIGPGEEFFLSNQKFHTDYFKRWQKPGDERNTNVPAKSPTGSFSTTESYVSAIYHSAETLITRGDVVRLQDVSLSYLWPIRHDKQRWIKTLRVFAYARNLGIVWKANGNDIDPDYQNAHYVAPKSFACGIQLDF